VVFGPVRQSAESRRAQSLSCTHVNHVALEEALSTDLANHLQQQVAVQLPHQCFHSVALARFEKVGCQVAPPVLKAAHGEPFVGAKVSANLNVCSTQYPTRALVNIR